MIETRSTRGLARHECLVGVVLATLVVVLLNYAAILLSNSNSTAKFIEKLSFGVIKLETLTIDTVMDELRSRGVYEESAEGTIPKIVHQSWKTHLIPTWIDGHNGPLNFSKYIQSWARFNPDWQYMFWTDEDNQKLFMNTPALASFKTAFEDKRLPAIARADFSRYAYMYIFGGVYADIDFECLQPMDSWISNYSTSFVSSEPKDQTMALYRMPMVICNAIMGSRPGHPFWVEVMEEITRKVQRRAKECYTDVNFCTGPQMLQRVYEAWTSNADNEPLGYVESERFYPNLALYNGDLKKGCKKLEYEGIYKCGDVSGPRTYSQPPYAEHHWGCSWCWTREENEHEAISALIPKHQLLRPFD